MVQRYAVEVAELHKLGNDISPLLCVRIYIINDTVDRDI